MSNEVNVDYAALAAQAVQAAQAAAAQAAAQQQNQEVETGAEENAFDIAKKDDSEKIIAKPYYTIGQDESEKIIAKPYYTIGQDESEKIVTKPYKLSPDDIQSIFGGKTKLPDTVPGFPSNKPEFPKKFKPADVEPATDYAEQLTPLQKASVETLYAGDQELAGLKEDLKATLEQAGYSEEEIEAELANLETEYLDSHKEYKEVRAKYENLVADGDKDLDDIKENLKNEGLTDEQIEELFPEIEKAYYESHPEYAYYKQLDAQDKTAEQAPLLKFPIDVKPYELKRSLENFDFSDDKVKDIMNYVYEGLADEELEAVYEETGEYPTKEEIAEVITGRLNELYAKGEIPNFVE